LSQLQVPKNSLLLVKRAFHPHQILSGFLQVLLKIAGVKMEDGADGRSLIWGQPKTISREIPTARAIPGQLWDVFSFQNAGQFNTGHIH